MHTVTRPEGSQCESTPTKIRRHRAALKMSNALINYVVAQDAPEETRDYGGNHTEFRT